MRLPLLKLGTLALRTLSKPIANRIKKDAGFHPKFREFVINIAQTNHRFTTKIQRRIYEHATDVAIHPLDEERAVQVAADLIGELFLFMVAGLGLVYEWRRNLRAEARKEEQRKQEVEKQIEAFYLKQKNKELDREEEDVFYLKQKNKELERHASGTSELQTATFPGLHQIMASPCFWRSQEATKPFPEK